MKNHKKGFTLLEVLLVVAALGVLAGIVVVALNPGRQLGDTRNAQRRADVNTILNAVYQYAIDNDGNLPVEIDTETESSQVLGTAGTACAAIPAVAGAVDLSSALVPTYLAGIPQDPKTGSTLDTRYYINKDASGRVTVGACNPEQSAVISVTR